MNRLCGWKDLIAPMSVGQKRLALLNIVQLPDLEWRRRQAPYSFSYRRWTLSGVWDTSNHAAIWGTLARSDWVAPMEPTAQRACGWLTTFCLGTHAHAGTGFMAMTMGLSRLTLRPTKVCLSCECLWYPSHQCSCHSLVSSIDGSTLWVWIDSGILPTHF